MSRRLICLLAPLVLSLSLGACQQPSSALDSGPASASTGAVPGTGGVTAVTSPPASEAQRKAAQLMYGLLSDSRYAYAPRPLSAELGNDVFRRYLEQLDSQRLLLTQEDLNALKSVQKRMQQAIQGNDLAAAVEVQQLLLKRLDERYAYAQKLLDTKFDFSTPEVWQSDRSKAAWPQTPADLNKLWQQYIKNDVLRLRLAGQKDDVIRSTLNKRYQRARDQAKRVTPDDAFTSFMNAYASAIDPHTNYLPTFAAQTFDIDMSLALEGIGAVLGQRDTGAEIQELIPGGPAAASNKLKKGDNIVSVGEGPKGKMVDVVGWRLDEIVRLIRGKKGTQVRLGIKPLEDAADAPAVVISLKRERVKLEEQSAKKSIVDINGRRIGVIRLPAFYQDFEGVRAGRKDAASATTDVAKLLGELQMDNVEGVVIDLRGNGGGSLTEAIDLSGLFIETGPVVQVREAGGRISAEGDRNPQVAWKGPLAVLTDRSSASASEIFAAAIQDYERGVIVGENTFGKGTVQSVVDLDSFSRTNEGLGKVKLTVAKFFRINGSTTQRLGVKPDIAYPVSLGAEVFGESMFDNAMAPSRIGSLDHKFYNGWKSQLPYMRAQHAARMGQDPELRWWLEDVALFNSKRQDTTVSLNESARRAERQEEDARQKDRAVRRKALGLAPADVHLDDGLNPSERKREDETVEGERPDPLLREAAAILSDMVAQG